MLHAFVPDFEKAFSSERLEGYRDTAATADVDMLTNYFWNVALCEAMMPTFHAVEVILRNAMHDALTDKYGTPVWFNSRATVKNAEWKSVESANWQARKSLADAGRYGPPGPGKVVAEFSFGFWVAMLSDRYQRDLWQPNQFALFKQVVPYGEGERWSRHDVHRRLDGLRKLRNRVSHHEPIWRRTDLADRYADAHELVGWINPTLYRAIRCVDDFAAVRLGRDQVKRRLIDALTGP